MNEEKVMVYERFVRESNGRYRRYVRWDGQDDWIVTDTMYDRPPYKKYDWPVPKNFINPFPRL